MLEPTPRSYAGISAAILPATQLAHGLLLVALSIPPASKINESCHVALQIILRQEVRQKH